MLRRSQPRTGLAGTLQRVAIAVLPEAPLPPPARRLLSGPTDDADLARERARRALTEARQAMGGMIPEDPDEERSVEAGSSAVSPDLERLQSYLEEADRER